MTTEPCRRVAAALLCYSHGELSQSKAAEIAGTSRAEFIDDLAHRRIPVERLAPAILVPDAVIEEVRVGEHKDRTAATAVEWAERFQGSFLGKVVWSLRTKALLGVLGERCLLGSILI